MAKQMQFEPSLMAVLGEKGDLLHSVQRALRVLSLIAEHPRAYQPARSAIHCA
jgi:hypothetical protein